jgi:hypothetical protein
MQWRNTEMISTRKAVGQRPQKPAARVSLMCVAAALIASAMFTNAHADAPAMAVALRAGTPGIGVDFDVGLGDRFGARIGYSNLSISHSVNTSDANYNGNLKLSIPSALADWYVFKGVFHLTAGLAANGTKLDLNATPGPNGFTLHNNTYSAAEVSSVNGTVKFGNSAAPYAGFGWGNPVSPNHRVHVLFDVGAIYGGAPKVSLNAQCVNSAANQALGVCTTLNSDVMAEEQRITNSVSFLKWFPVVNLGFSVRL